MARRESDIIVVKLSSLGDVIHALQAISILERLGGFNVIWIVKERYFPLFKGIDWIVPFTPTFSNILSLRKKGFYLGIDMQGLIKSSLILYLIRPGIRAGFSGSEVREKLATALYNFRVDTRGERHVVKKLRKLLTVSLGVKDDDIYAIPMKVDDSEIELTYRYVEDDKFILVLPSGGWESKKLKLSWVSELVEKIKSKIGIKVYILPGLEDVDRYKKSSLGNLTLPSLGLREAIALILRASAVIGPDTGFLHVASAFGVPVVGIYGPSDPVRNGPFSYSKSVVVYTMCSSIGCGKKNCPTCTLKVPLDSVISALRNVL
ncbi:MAG: glycosyltransferase family 9 protein [Thermosulfidibacteraceae bacterium]